MLVMFTYSQYHAGNMMCDVGCTCVFEMLCVCRLIWQSCAFVMKCVITRVRAISLTPTLWPSRQLHRPNCCTEIINITHTSDWSPSVSIQDSEDDKGTAEDSSLHHRSGIVVLLLMRASIERLSTTLDEAVLCFVSVFWQLCTVVVCRWFCLNWLSGFADWLAALVVKRKDKGTPLLQTTSCLLFDPCTILDVAIVNVWFHRQLPTFVVIDHQ